MLKALLKVRLLAIVSWFTGSSRKKKAQSKGQLIGFAALMLYAFGAMGFLFWHLFDTIAAPFHTVGLDWLYFAMLIIMSFALMFIGSVFTAKAQLFEAKDNDLLLSLPLKTGDILLSRMFMLLVISAVFGLLVTVPAGIVWGKAVGFTGAGLVAFIVAFVLLVLLTLTISSLFGWLLSLLTAKMQRKSLVTTLISLLFLGAYMYVCFNMNNLITGLAAQPDAAAAAVGAVAPLYKLSAYIAAGDLTGMLLSSVIIIALSMGTYLLLSVFFMSAAAGQHGGKKVKYVARELKTATPRQALFGRELSRFLSCSPYILNCGLGAIMTIVGAAVLLIKRDAIRDIITQIPGLDMLLPPLAALSLCLLSTMTLISAPSVSLEGRSIWIAQSLPVGTDAIFRAKLRLHNIISIVPVVAAAAAAAVVLKASGLMLLSMLLLPTLFGLFVGLLGLAENVRHPSLDWTNETQAVKNGISVMLTMFISWALLALPVIVYVLFGDGLSLNAVAVGYMLLVGVLCVLIYRWLMVKGVERFMDL